MSDDDSTPRLSRPRSHWGDEQRAAIGAVQRRELARSYPQGVPVAPPSDLDDLTPVFDLLDRDPTEDERRVTARSRRGGDAPLTANDLAKLLTHVDKRIAKLRDEERSNNQERADQLLELLNRPPGEDLSALQAQVGKIEEHVAGHRRLIRWLAIAALGSVTAVAGLIYARGLSEGGNAVRIELLQRAVDDMRTDLRALGRRSDATTFPPAKSPDAISSASKD